MTAPPSYKVTCKIAQCKKPHKIAEELILPSALEMDSTMQDVYAAFQMILKYNLSIE